MNDTNKINYYDLIENPKKLNHPFSREIYIANIKEEFGKGIGIKYDFGNGMAIFVRSFSLKKDTSLVEESDVRATSFIFNLGSTMSFVYKDNKAFTLEKNNFLSALASENFKAEVLIKKDEPYLSFSIGIKEELFMQLAHPIENINEHIQKLKNNTYMIFHNGKIDPQQLEMINYFKDEHAYEDQFKNLLLESKATDLLHYTIEKIAHNLSKVADLNLDMDKINSLEKAKKLILEEYHKPLSIKEIAYKSAINECYLKKDFKAYYGMTIFEMLQKHRMEKCKTTSSKKKTVLLKMLL